MKLSAYFFVLIFALSTPSIAFAAEGGISPLVTVPTTVGVVAFGAAKLIGFSTIGSVVAAGGSIFALAGAFAYAFYSAMEHAL